MSESRLAGRLLVASPTLLDPNFNRTVVLILEHDRDEGALGVVLNRPSEADVGVAVPEWRRFAADPAVVFVGGPVSPGAAICLAVGQSGREVEGWRPLFGSLGTVDVGRDPEDLAGCVERIRVFAGYAGWSGGQLETELDQKAWYVLPTAPDDALCPGPDELWRRVLRRQGGRLAWVANYPPDLSTN